MSDPLDLWLHARGDYAWKIDLAHFGNRHEYHGYFDRVVDSQDVSALEESFRRAVDNDGSPVVAGEVCYWKNYGTYVSRDRLTTRLLKHLSEPAHWRAFREAVRAACVNPTFEAFRRLQASCDQPKGFATPVTFLAFYRPETYPMADRHIADWWQQNKARDGFGDEPAFCQRSDGWIETTSIVKTKRNWKAYLAWAKFCRDVARNMPGWRARDVEMAVWTAQKQEVSLPRLMGGSAGR